jgi:hypothetical protein
MSYGKNERQRISGMVSQLKANRQSFEAHWRELADNILPSALRLDETKENNGDKKYGDILDSTATTAARTLASGIMAGLTRPSDPWFALKLKDSSIAETQEVKDWLHKCTEKMLDVVSGSNMYGVFRKIYLDASTFATSAAIVEEDPVEVIRGKHFPLGEYWLAVDNTGKVRTFYLEFSRTVEQIVDEYGKKANGEIDWSGISPKVKDWYDQDKMLNKVKVGQLIRANKDYDPNKIDAQYKKFSSCHFEVSTGVSENRFLRKSGYDYFPVLAPRWSTYGNDDYGTDSPGMLALGDTKQLQYGEKKKLQAIEKKINPPMVGPTSLQNQKIGITSGDVVFEDARDGSKGFRSAHEVNISLAELGQLQVETRERIKNVMHESAFKRISDLDKSGATAREIAELKEEKLLEIGPVFEQFEPDLLNPFIEIVYTIMNRRGMIPKPPDSLNGKSVAVEYKSILDQARKSVNVATNTMFLEFSERVAAANPQVRDKINYDALIDTAASDMGVNPTLVKGKDEVDKVRQNRAAVQAQQMKLQEAALKIQAAQQLSGIPTQDGNALDTLSKGAQGNA